MKISKAENRMPKEVRSPKSEGGLPRMDADGHGWCGRVGKVGPEKESLS